MQTAVPIALAIVVSGFIEAALEACAAVRSRDFSSVCWESSAGSSRYFSRARQQRRPNSNWTWNARGARWTPQRHWNRLQTQPIGILNYSAVGSKGGGQGGLRNRQERQDSVPGLVGSGVLDAHPDRVGAGYVREMGGRKKV